MYIHRKWQCFGVRVMSFWFEFRNKILNLDLVDHLTILQNMNLDL